jgi:hypothetical protein
MAEFTLASSQLFLLWLVELEVFGVARSQYPFGLSIWVWCSIRKSKEVKVFSVVEYCQ